MAKKLEKLHTLDSWGRLAMLFYIFFYKDYWELNEVKNEKRD